jgi:hypothetical protein
MSGSRILISDASVTTIVVGPRRSWFTIIAGGPALCVFAIGGASSVYAVLNGDFPGIPSKLFAALWLFGWICLGALFVFQVAWDLFGTWTVVVDSDTLTISARIRHLSRSWSYRRADVVRLRIHEVRGRRGVFRTIAFDYFGKLTHTTPNLSEQEALLIIQGPLRGLTGPTA